MEEAETACWEVANISLAKYKEKQQIIKNDVRV
jgi:hypothetical protein